MEASAALSYVVAAFLLVRIGFGATNAHSTQLKVFLAPIALDAVDFEGPRLLITVSPQRADGSDLPPQKLLLDTGSGGLAFCNRSFQAELKSLATRYYDCGSYGVDKRDASGYWGSFYKGGLQLSKTDVLIPDAYYSVMRQEAHMPCQTWAQGIFGITPGVGDMSAIKPSWRSHQVGPCPETSRNFVEPLMKYLDHQGGTKQIGIYWSGQLGDGEGQMYLGHAATSNPYYDADKAARIGKAKLGVKDGYGITIQNFAYNGKTYPDVTDFCKLKGCVIDTGTVELLVPHAVHDDMIDGKSGELIVAVEGLNGSLVHLKFDVEILLTNGWVSSSGSSEMLILGLSMRAFYYVVMDITDRSLSFSPMPAYFKESPNASVLV